MLGIVKSDDAYYLLALFLPKLAAELDAEGSEKVSGRRINCVNDF